MRHVPRSIVALVACGIVGSACKDRNTPTLAAGRSALPDSADQVMFGVHTSLLTGGIRRGELRADTAFTYDQGTRLELRKVNTVFFDASGAKTSTMTAREGTYNIRNRVLDGRGDVVVASTDGRRLASPHLVYDQGVNQISSDTTFRYSTPGSELSGTGFRSDPQLRSVQVLRNAGGRAAIPGSSSPARRR